MMLVLACLLAASLGAANGAVSASGGTHPPDETTFWQGRIDAAAKAGGGIVAVPAGDHEVGELTLRSHVELHLERGSRLLGKVGPRFYSQTKLPNSEGTWGAVVFAVGVTNAAVTGEGTIDGRGAAWPHEGFCPRGIFFANSSDIRVEGVTFVDSANWGIVFKRCDGVMVRRVRVSTNANHYNDGIDIEARNVVVADCDVDSSDDAICIKSNDPQFTVENILVTNCLVRSHCNAFKLGTASHGTMRNIRFVGCRSEAPRRCYRYRSGKRAGRNSFYWTATDEFPLGIGIGAINVECVDGGRVEDILFDDIDIRGFQVPIFIRGGRRLHRSNGIPPGNQYVLRNVTLRHIRGEAYGTSPSTITGTEECRPENILLEDVRIVCRTRKNDDRPICEPSLMYRGFYPDADMFNALRLPAYGLYIDRGDVRMEDVAFSLRTGERDTRPAVFTSTTESARRRADPLAFACPLEVSDRELADRPALVTKLRSNPWDRVTLSVEVRKGETFDEFADRLQEFADFVRDQAPQASIDLRRTWEDPSFDRIRSARWGFLVRPDRVRSDCLSDPIRSPAFFWMWNDRLELPKLCAQLEDMRAHGVRNVCIHPFPKGFRPTSCPSRMEPEYLSEAFLAVVSNVVGRAASLGMHAYLYDEGGWPSGGACGQVARSDAEGRFRRREIGADGKVAVIDYPPGSPCPSILEKGEVERFIELTHEKYARYLGGDFGKSVKIAFTDEPNRHAGKPGKTLGWMADFAEVFKAKKGYDLVPFVGDLIRRNDETDDVLAARRIDYCEVAADLFVERYVKPLRDWCRGHGILSGGHFNGEDEPVMSRHYGHGNLLRSLRGLDVPGVDVIWKQLAPRTDGAHRERSLPFPRYASSAAHQIGGAYALSETFGIYGDSLDPFELKWNVDFQLVRGINTFVFGYYSYSEWGPWMTLFEPHFGPSSPCWDFMPHLFGYVTRCCETLSRGRPGAECAVLYDVRGFWAGGADTEAAARVHDAVALALDNLQVDYDFFDEDILREGTVGQGAISLGKMEYRTLVLPTSKWLTDASKAKLDAFRAAGGIVADLNTLSRVPRTLRLRGGNSSLRVMKRIDNGANVYFLVNSSRDAVETEIEFPEGGRVVRFEADTGRRFVASTDGCVRRTFAGGESAIFIAGKADDADRFVEAGKPILTLEDGWTARKVAEHFVGQDRLGHRAVEDAPKPVRLGDWRTDFGETFSGRVVYRTEFTAEKAGPVEIDLGEVRYCAGVALNGVDLGKRFFGPYAWRGFLKKGINRLEVEVCNLLVNQTGDERIRARINRDHPPRSSYDVWQRPFDLLNHESGLYGPVTVSPIAYGEESLEPRLTD